MYTLHITHDNLRLARQKRFFFARELETSNNNLTMRNGTARNEDDNFFALIFKITKLSLNVELDRYCDL